MLQWGAKDSRVIKKEIDCIYNHLAAADKKLVIYKDAQHESLCQNSPKEWEKQIEDFLSR